MTKISNCVDSSLNMGVCFKQQIKHKVNFNNSLWIVTGEAGKTDIISYMGRR